MPNGMHNRPASPCSNLPRRSTCRLLSSILRRRQQPSSPFLPSITFVPNVPAFYCLCAKCAAAAALCFPSCAA